MKIIGKKLCRTKGVQWPLASVTSLIRQGVTASAGTQGRLRDMDHERRQKVPVVHEEKEAWIRGKSKLAWDMTNMNFPAKLPSSWSSPFFDIRTNINLVGETSSGLSM